MLPLVQRPAVHSPSDAQLGSVATGIFDTVGVCQFMITSPARFPPRPTRRFGSTQTSFPSLALQPQVASVASQSPSSSVSAPGPPVHTPPWQVSPIVHGTASLQIVSLGFGVARQVPEGS